MYILSVIPLAKIPFPAPQILDYFSGKKVSQGGIVRISLGSRKVLGVVIACASVKQLKQQIKKSSFLLKQVDEILNPGSIIQKPVLQTALWASEYFYAPLGLVLKSLIPQTLRHPTKKILKELAERKVRNAVEENRMTPPEKPILYLAIHNEPEKIAFYRNSIQKTLKNKKSVLFLVPERYKIEYFQKKIPELQNTSCIIGTRSTFARLSGSLGLIVVDEEESPLYKSFDQQPYIHAKEIALHLAQSLSAQVVLGSDFPSFESLWKATKGEYFLQKAQPQTSDLKLPISKVIDMREELKGGNYSILSKELQTQLREVLKKNQQAVLFINRRGLSTGLLCRDCGHVVKCPNCDVPMVYHATNFQFPTSNFQLICHHCGQKQKPPTLCPKCQGSRIKFIGTGTQRVEQELQRFYEKARIARLDTDIAPKWILQKKIFSDFKAKKYTILIGTQLMLKPELLPEVAFSAIITIDPLLSIPDFRMAEQILRVVDKLKNITLSEVVLQTYTPDSYIINYVIKSLLETTDVNQNVLNKFLENELQNRALLSFPPFSQLIKLVYRHENPQKAEQEAQTLKNKLETASREIGNFAILGPAPAFIPRVKGGYVWQIMIKSKIIDIPMRNKILRVVPSDWKIDVDPIEML